MNELDRPPQKLGRSPKRLALAGAGTICVGLAFIGAFTPGLPTTVFLIAASYLFARSCPVLEQKLLRVPVFRPYLKFLDGQCPIPKAARWSALFWLWAGVTVSLLILAAREGLGPWLAAGILTAALVGSAVIWTYRQAPKPCPHATRAKRD